MTNIEKYFGNNTTIPDLLMSNMINPTHTLSTLLQEKSINYDKDVDVQIHQMKYTFLMRPIDSKHSNALKNVIINDPNWRNIFSITPIIVALDQADGVYKVIEGNHRLNAIRNFNEESHINYQIKSLKVGYILKTELTENEYRLIACLAFQFGKQYRKPLKLSEMISIARNCLKNPNFITYDNIKNARFHDEKARTIFAQLFCCQEKHLIRSIRRFSVFSDTDFQFICKWLDEDACHHHGFWETVTSNYQKCPKAVMEELYRRFECVKLRKSRQINFSVKYESEPFLRHYNLWNSSWSLNEHLNYIYNCNMNLIQTNVEHLEESFTKLINNRLFVQKLSHIQKETFKSVRSKLERFKNIIEKYNKKSTCFNNQLTHKCTKTPPTEHIQMLKDTTNNTIIETSNQQSRTENETENVNKNQIIQPDIQVLETAVNKKFPQRCILKEKCFVCTGNNTMSNLNKETQELAGFIYCAFLYSQKTCHTILSNYREILKIFIPDLDQRHPFENISNINNTTVKLVNNDSRLHETESLSNTINNENNIEKNAITTRIRNTNNETSKLVENNTKNKKTNHSNKNKRKTIEYQNILPTEQKRIRIKTQFFAPS